MRILSFRRVRYFLSTATLIALVWVSSGGATPVGGLELQQNGPDPVIAAAGDIACDPDSSSFNEGEGNPTSCRQKSTSDLLVDANLAAVLPLGDVQYHCGGYEAFMQSYDPSWGRVKSISRPVVGNHEYLTFGGTDCDIDNTGAAGYFRYFGEAAGEPSQGYYSYDIGAWHLIALNSNCGDAGGCGLGSPQVNWLLADLAAHRNLCTLAYWHIPLFSSGGRTAVNTQVIWEVLYNHNVDLILNGHDHIYERFAPQAPDGRLDLERGIRQFVVGTGGSNHTEFETLAANSEVRHTGTYGVLMLTLRSDRYDWSFVPEEGGTFTDSGSAECHGDVPGIAPTVAVAPTLIPTEPPDPATTSHTFTPVADAYISKTLPALNFGASNMLRVYGGPLGASYLRFDIRDLSGAVSRATLRLYAHGPSNAGYQVRSVNDQTWDETRLTYENAPPLGELITVSEPFDAKQWTSVDLTSLVRGEGTYSVVLTTFDGVPLSLASRNAVPPYSPRLVVDVLPGSGTAPAATEPTDITIPLE